MPSPSLSGFDPSAIPQFSVISLPYAYQGDPQPQLKRFVVISHIQEFAFCIKATSKVSLYINNPQMLAGCVLYRAGECDCFECDTAVQPDNQVPIRHADISSSHERGELQILGTMPEDFKERLRAAANNSFRIVPRERNRLLQFL